MRNELLTALLVLTAAASALTAEEKGKPETPGPAAITLLERHGHATPRREGFQHTGGGNIDVAQPAPDTIVITMTGVAVAGPHPCKNSTASFTFDLIQDFEVALDKPKDRTLKLTMEARVIGLLRSHSKGGCAEESGACASVTSASSGIASLCAPPHSVAGGESLSINDHTGPVSVTIVPGKYTLHEAFQVSATNPRGLVGKTASAEFAPDPALDPLWISAFEPFHGAIKKDFGFQVTLKVSAE